MQETQSRQTNLFFATFEKYQVRSKLLVPMPLGVSRSFQKNSFQKRLNIIFYLIFFFPEQLFGGFNG